MSPSRVIASAVTTPQPPAVVSTTVFGPFGSGCVANVAAASNASVTSTARVIPAARHSPSKILSFAASAPVWLAAALRAALGRAALHQHERLDGGGARPGGPSDRARR